MWGASGTSLAVQVHDDCSRACQYHPCCCDGGAFVAGPFVENPGAPCVRKRGTTPDRGNNTPPLRFAPKNPPCGVARGAFLRTKLRSSRLAWRILGQQRCRDDSVTKVSTDPGPCARPLHPGRGVGPPEYNTQVAIHPGRAPSAPHIPHPASVNDPLTQHTISQRVFRHTHFESITPTCGGRPVRRAAPAWGRPPDSPAKPVRPRGTVWPSYRPRPPVRRSGRRTAPSAPSPPWPA